MSVEGLILADRRENRKQTLLLLGASLDQVYAIRTARQMGLRTLAVDMNPSSPGFKDADDYAVISTRDVPALKQFVDQYREKGHEISGVIVMGSDIPQVVCALAGHLGTPRIPIEAAELSIHKYKMKCRFKEKGVPVPWFSPVDSADHLRQIAHERGFPLTIKPVDRSGARGVFYLSGDDNNLEQLFVRSRDVSFSGEVMVEEFLKGLQISTESIMYKGRAYTPGLADRNYEMIERFAPYIIENGGWVPSCLSAGDRKAVEALVENAGRALGVENGVVKGDVVFTPDGPKIIEMATRLSGGDFSESLIPLGCGVNIVEAAINLAVGRKPDLDKLRPRFQKGVVNRYFFPRPGKLIRIEGKEEARQFPWLKKLELWYEPGDEVPEVKSHADRFGVFIATGETRREAEQRAEQIYATIEIITEPQ